MPSLNLHVAYHTEAVTCDGIHLVAIAAALHVGRAHPAAAAQDALVAVAVHPRRSVGRCVGVEVLVPAVCDPLLGVADDLIEAELVRRVRVYRLRPLARLAVGTARIVVGRIIVGVLLRDGLAEPERGRGARAREILAFGFA